MHHSTYARARKDGLVDSFHCRWTLSEREYEQDKSQVDGIDGGLEDEMFNAVYD